MNAIKSDGSEEFWQARFERALSMGKIHRAVCDTSSRNWRRIQEVHGRIICEHVATLPRNRVLEVPCGYGATVELLPDGIGYCGIDCCHAMLQHARQEYPNREFLHSKHADYRVLDFKDNEFDLAVCRSLDGTIQRHFGYAAWRTLENELLRVASRVLLLGYRSPEEYRVFNSVRGQEEFAVHLLEVKYGRLEYRAGQDKTYELYDLHVDAHHRRQGIASRLVKMLMDIAAQQCGTVYGFTRKENTVAQQFYASQRFTLFPVPGFYRGSDGVMFVRKSTPADLER